MSENDFPMVPAPQIRPEQNQKKLADLWDKDNPRAVINLIPDSLREKFDEAFQNTPELFGIDEKLLKHKLLIMGQSPTPTDHRIRLKFWFEYDRAQEENKNINMISVLAGVCSRQFFEQHYVRYPGKVAWLLTPPAEYANVTQEALAFGMEQLREMLEIPNIDPVTGKPNVKMMELKAKIVAMLDLRVKGGITQRIEQKNLGLTIHTTDKSVAALAQQGSMEDIEKRIKELDARAARAQNTSKAPQVLEAESSGEE